MKNRIISPNILRKTSRGLWYVAQHRDSRPKTSPLYKSRIVPNKRRKVGNYEAKDEENVPIIPLPKRPLWGTGGCGTMSTACGAGASDTWPCKKPSFLGGSGMDTDVEEDPAPPMVPNPEKRSPVVAFGFPGPFLFFGTVVPFGTCCTLASCSTFLLCNSLLGVTYGDNVSPTTRVSSMAGTHQIPTAHWCVVLDGFRHRGPYVVSTSHF